MTNAIITILLLHFIADFIFQTNKMAINKSRSIKWLSIHAGVYTFVIYIGLILGNIIGWIPDINLLLYAVVNGLLHWIIDFCTSKLNAYLYKKELRHWFFVGIGLDQFIHSLCLIKTLE